MNETELTTKAAERTATSNAFRAREAMVDAECAAGTAEREAEKSAAAKAQGKPGRASYHAYEAIEAATRSAEEARRADLYARYAREAASWARTAKAQEAAEEAEEYATAAARAAKRADRRTAEAEATMIAVGIANEAENLRNKLEATAPEE